jgi:hypothetical protein
MKPLYVPPVWYAGVILLLALAVLSMGCNQQSSPGAAATTASTSGQGLKAPVQTTAAVTMIDASLPYGVTITYPSDWERQNILTTGVRDYGQNTLNIANFFSPDEITGDPLSYNSLSIDVDQNVQTDFDTYFNQATLAVGKTYGTQMEAHSYSLKIGGYDSYELDFQTSDVKGTYIFTNAGGSMYIFAFKGPTKPLAVSAFATEKVDMYKSIQLNPPALSVTKQR